MKKESSIQKIKREWPVYLLKLSLTTFILAIFLILFFVLNCTSIFYRTNYVSAFTGSDFQVHVINVGQGDSFLIKLPRDKTLLIDCGNESHGDVVKSYIKQYFANENLSKINYLVLTHTDMDHIGGGKEVIDSFDVENLYRPKCYSVYESENLINQENYKVSDSVSYDYIIKKAYENEVNIVFNQKGITIEEDGFKIEFLSPDEDSYTNSNDYSAVIMISCHGKKFLFTGDASIDIENKLINEYGTSLKADVLKLGHHGSNTSSSEAFLEVVKPEYAIISVDKNNSYSLPAVEVLNKLHDKNVDIISTADCGNFAFAIFNDNLTFKCENQNRIDAALLLSITIFFILVIWAFPIKFVNKKFYINKK